MLTSLGSISVKVTQMDSCKEFEWDDWLFRSTHLPISNSEELENIQRNILPNAAALPTMVFGGNKLCLLHQPSGFTVEFNTLDALLCVKWNQSTKNNKDSTDLKIASAKEWESSRMEIIESLASGPAFDWTFTPQNYMGKYPESAFSFQELENDDKGIDYQLLTDTTEPILLFDENILYEDELADNGLAQLSVKIRVMPKCFLVLMRFYLRVEKVLLRSAETRLFHVFGNDRIIRQHIVRELSTKDPEFPVLWSEIVDNVCMYFKHIFCHYLVGCR